jgi:hypothetical protein
MGQDGSTPRLVVGMVFAILSSIVAHVFVGDICDSYLTNLREPKPLDDATRLERLKIWLEKVLYIVYVCNIAALVGILASRPFVAMRSVSEQSALEAALLTIVIIVIVRMLCWLYESAVVRPLVLWIDAGIGFIALISVYQPTLFESLIRSAAPNKEGGTFWDVVFWVPASATGLVLFVELLRCSHGALVTIRRRLYGEPIRQGVAMAGMGLRVENNMGGDEPTDPDAIDRQGNSMDKASLQGQEQRCSD